jgi:hypothetical protein
MDCSLCGTQNPENSEHCLGCGQLLGTVHAERPARTERKSSVSKAQQVRVLGQVDIAGTTVTVSEQEISFGKRVLRCGDIAGIRYGIYKHYINGIRDSQSYAIWLTDGRSTMLIECAKGFFVGSSTIESRYQEVLKVLFPAVIVPTVQGFLTNLDNGTGFQVGDITFDKTGLHRADSFGAIQKGILGAWVAMAGGLSVEEREQKHQHLSWSEFGGHSLGDGSIHLFRETHEWASFKLRDTWNAVCLVPFFEFLREDNRLWSYVDR